MRPHIIRRLDAALETMRARDMAVRAIYLTPEDWRAFNEAQSEAWGSKLCTFSYGEHQIRSGERSRIYSTHGVGVDVPKRVNGGAHD